MDPRIGLQFQQDGFVHLRDVFSAEEIARFREAVLKEADRGTETGQRLKSVSGETVPCRDVASVPGLEGVVFDQRLVRVAQLLLGVQKPVYFGDSSVMVGGAQRGFHKDSSNRDDPSHSDWQSPYGLVRMGIYLQDHSNHSGGLRLRVGSHLHADVTTGRSYAVPTRPGDVVVWNLRTTHSGHAVRIRGMKSLPLQPRVEFRLPQPLRTGEEKLRAAIFMTYGANGCHLETYLRKHTDTSTYPENYLLRAWEHSNGGESMISRAEQAGVEFRRPILTYGQHYGDKRYPEGYVPNRSSVADVYPAKGLEAAIQLAGKAWRMAERILRRQS